MRKKLIVSSVFWMAFLEAVSWTPAKPINSTSAAGDGEDVFTAYDPAHHLLIAAWTSSEDVPLAATSADHGNTWSVPVPISSATIYQDPFPIYFPTNKSIVVTWEDNVAFNPQSAISEDGGITWTTHMIAAEGVSGVNLFTAYDSNNGTLVAAWGNGSGANNPIASLSSDGSIWSASPVVISNTAEVGYDVFSAYDPVHKTVVSSFRNVAGSSNFPVAFISTTDGNTWDGPVPISSSPDYPIGNVFISYLQDGVLLATWIDANGHPTSTLSGDGGNSWGPSIQISSGEVYCDSIFTAFNPATGMLIAAWQDLASMNPYYAFSTNGGMSWSQAAPLSSISSLNDIQVILDPVSGFFVATWMGLQDELPYYALLAILNTEGLHGNNRIFASYLNDNAPFDTLALFTPLSKAELKQALEAAAPTRNALTTFASQNGYLASSQALSDHLRQKRFHMQPQRKNQVEFGEYLLVDASNVIEQPPVECAQKPYTVWLAPFGEYAHEKKQQQTPAFSVGTGGFFTGFDCNGLDVNAFGIGGAYIYTHIHESQKAGYANLNQGFLTAYGTLHAAKWYCDLAVWGGYYASDNFRRIAFPGYEQTTKSHPHGWQTASHVEVGYDESSSIACDGKRWGIEPFIMGDWVGNWERGFQEHGADGLNVNQKGKFCSLFRGESGLRIHEIVKFDWGDLIFREKGSYGYQKTFRTGSVTAFLVGSPGSFTVETLTGAQNLGVVELEVFFLPFSKKCPYGILRYQGEYGSRYQSHQSMLEIGLDF